MSTSPKPEDSEYPLILNPAYIRPMPESMWGIACGRCNRTQARWELHEPVEVEGGFEPREEFIAICSLCFLYESPWAQRRAHKIRHLITEIEQSIGSKFLMDIGGRLLMSEDGDRVLAAISLSSRMAYSMAERALGGSPDGH